MRENHIGETPASARAPAKIPRTLRREIFIVSGQQTCLTQTGQYWIVRKIGAPCERSRSQLTDTAPTGQAPVILVTGASGFLGLHLVRYLHDHDMTVRAAARNIAVFEGETRISSVQMPNVMRPANWEPLLTGVDCVIHLAGIAHRSATDEEHEQGNHLATRDLAIAAKQAGIRHFIFVSSIAAQSGPSSETPLDETSPPVPTTPYGRAKFAAETAVRASGVPFTILRPVVVYGEGAKGNFATLVKIAGLPLPLPLGSLTNRRSMLAVGNFNTAILTVMTNLAARNEMFVVADPEPCTIGEVIGNIRAGMNRPPGLLPVPPAWLELLFRVTGRQTLWQRLGGSLVVNPGKLLALGWKPDEASKPVKKAPQGQFS